MSWMLLSTNLATSFRLKVVVKASLHFDLLCYALHTSLVVSTAVGQKLCDDTHSWKAISAPRALAICSVRSAGPSDKWHI